jgi:hypothetical protein
MKTKWLLVFLCALAIGNLFAMNVITRSYEFMMPNSHLISVNLDPENTLHVYYKGEYVQYLGSRTNFCAYQ